MADEKGRASEAAPVAGRLTRLLSLDSLIIQQTSPPMPPPLLPQTATAEDQIPPPAISMISRPPTPNSDAPHPIAGITQEQELGKLVINVAVPAAIALLLTSSNGGAEKLLVVHAVTVGVMIGCAAIWNGILFRKAFPCVADILEQFGISLVFLSLYGYVASLLPIGFSWLVWLSGVLGLLPFIYARIERQAAAAAGQAGA